MNYYNEFDPNAAAWLRELIARKLIPAGVVDDRSITEIKPHELDGYTQCHFFAGIGGWALALHLAGWPSTRPVWTASLPCQPWSAAGAGEGAEDDRHLWPVFHRLVAVQRPERIFGEQVAAAIGFDWLDGISADLESDGYTVGATVLGAFSVGAPHIRRRLYWVANAASGARAQHEREPREGLRGETIPSDAAIGGSDHDRMAKSDSAGHEGRPTSTEQRRFTDAEGGCPLVRLADGISEGLQGHAGDERDGNQPGRIGEESPRSVAASGTTLRMGDPASGGLGIVGDAAQPGSGGHADGAGSASGGVGNSEMQQCGGPRESESCDRWVGAIGRSDPWSDAYWHYCRDGKYRRVPTEPSLFPLADAGIYVVPGMARRRTVRPALLKGSGNAIVPQVAAEFIQTCEEILIP